MASLLIDEYPLIVLPQFAAAIGLHEALFVQQLHYWIKDRERKKEPQVDGRTWVYNTLEDWLEQFPFMSKATLRRTIREVEATGLVISDHREGDRWNRRKSYTVDYELIDMYQNDRIGFDQRVDQNRRSHVLKMSTCMCSNCAHRSAQNEHMTCAQIEHMIYTETTRDFSETTCEKLLAENNSEVVVGEDQPSAETPLPASSGPENHAHEQADYAPTGALAEPHQLGSFSDTAIPQAVQLEISTGSPPAPLSSMSEKTSGTTETGLQARLFGTADVPDAPPPPCAAPPPAPRAKGRKKAPASPLYKPVVDAWYTLHNERLAQQKKAPVLPISPADWRNFKAYVANLEQTAQHFEWSNEQTVAYVIEYASLKLDEPWWADKPFSLKHVANGIQTWWSATKLPALEREQREAEAKARREEEAKARTQPIKLREATPEERAAELEKIRIREANRKRIEERNKNRMWRGDRLEAQNERTDLQD